MGALNKPDWESDLSSADQAKQNNGEYYEPRLEEQDPAVAQLYAKINSLTDKLT